MGNNKNILTRKELEELKLVIGLIRNIPEIGRAYLLNRIFPENDVYRANKHNWETPRDKDGYDREFHDNYGGVFVGDYSPRYYMREALFDVIHALLGQGRGK